MPEGDNILVSVLQKIIVAAANLKIAIL